MKCKNCGGQLSFQQDRFVCESCGGSWSPDHFYEKLDVYICYQENDDAGRRTKDSIVAQEVYQKLEGSKITAFYERISADGFSDDELEASKLAAIHKSKVILVLAASVGNFSSLEEKYGAYFSGKTVIPFCVGVNPALIPKTLSKVQAMSYSTIGWDQDLIKGICNLLGREPELATTLLYGKRKRKIILIGVILAILLIGIVLAVLLWLNCGNKLEQTDAAQTQTTAAPAEKPLTVAEIYEKAKTLLEEGAYLEAARMFFEIPDYKDSTNEIKKIYDRYDGYYQGEEGNCFLYINVIDGKTVDFSFEKTVNQKIAKTEGSMVLENNQFSGSYTDNLQNEGTISATFYDTYIDLQVSTAQAANEICFGDVTDRYLLENKKDRPPVKEVTKELLLSWIKNLTYVDDIIEAGYELVYDEEFLEPEMSCFEPYAITNTDIILFVTDVNLSKYAGEDSDADDPRRDKRAVVAIMAPADVVSPEKVGKRAKVFTNDGILYVPNLVIVDGFYDSFAFFTELNERDLDSLEIKGDSYIGFTSKKQVGKYHYDNAKNELEKEFQQKLQCALVREKFKKDFPEITKNVSLTILEEKKDAALVLVHLSNASFGMSSSIPPGTFYYYKLNTKTEKATFIVEHRDKWYVANGYWNVSYDEWKKYPEIFGEFMSNKWADLPSDAMFRIVKAKVMEKYGIDQQSGLSYQIMTQNDKHYLICIQTEAMEQAGTCAWYKADKKVTTVNFVKEGHFEESEYSYLISEQLWFEEYPDFAKEFPDLYGAPGEDTPPEENQPPEVDEKPGEDTAPDDITLPIP